MTKGKKIYFASDFHLGVPDYKSSLQREKQIIEWLEMVRVDAEEIYLMGDVFDFWFEYKHVIPKGFVRFLGKLAELSDQGIKIVLFKGNHDMWMFDYLSQEIGVTIISDELIIEREGKRFFLHHGDGLGPDDGKYKLLKRVFRSKTCQWLFSWLHPSVGMAIARYWSKSSRIASNEKEVFVSEEKEWLVQFSNTLLESEHFDYLIFGHRHLPLSIRLDKGSLYLNLGEWINYKSYAVFDGTELTLLYWDKKETYDN